MGLIWDAFYTFFRTGPVGNRPGIKLGRKTLENRPLRVLPDSRLTPKSPSVAVLWRPVKFINFIRVVRILLRGSGGGAPKIKRGVWGAADPGGSPPAEGGGSGGGSPTRGKRAP